MSVTHLLPIKTPVKNSTLTENWKQALNNAITSPMQLINELGLHKELAAEIIKQPEFKCLVPRSYLKKIQYGNRNDPLLKQILPLTIENEPQGLLDPVGDLTAMPSSGLLHKYHGRALLITTGACAIHCRYCFRRHYPYPQAACKPSVMQKIFAYLRTHTNIDEIILSGGDPLVLDDSKLKTLFSQLESIDSLTSLRIHTRLPVVLPARIAENLLNLLKNSRFRITMVIHANHANELGDDEQQVLKQLHRADITLLNQSVLLKGINDDVVSLTQLSKRLHTCFTLPYYLHKLDPVQGAMHFDTSKQAAVTLIKKMRTQLPGYLVPQLVQEIPGNDSKTAIFSI